MVVFGQLQVLPRIQRQAGEGGVQFPVILKISRRHRELGLARAAFKNTDQLFRFAIRQRFEQHAVDHAEDCSVGTDAEREREHGDGGEAGVLQQLPEGKSQIIHGSLKALKGLKR